MSAEVNLTKTYEATNPETATIVVHISFGFGRDETPYTLNP